MTTLRDNVQIGCVLVASFFGWLNFVDPVVIINYKNAISKSYKKENSCNSEDLLKERFRTIGKVVNICVVSILLGMLSLLTTLIVLGLAVSVVAFFLNKESIVLLWLLPAIIFIILPLTIGTLHFFVCICGKILYGNAIEHRASNKHNNAVSDWI